MTANRSVRVVVWAMFVLMIAAMLAQTRSTLAADPIRRINAGGPELLIGPWSVDTNEQPSPFSNVNETGSRATLPTDDPQTADASVPSGTNTNLFRSHRFDPRGGPEMSWDFPVSNGGYEIRLFFSEIADEEAIPEAGRVTGPGQRLFDVSIEGAKVLDNFDVFTEAGGTDRGIARSFIVNVSGGLQIDFEHELQNPMISGIEIIPVDASNSPMEALPSALTLVARPSTSITATVAVSNSGGAAAPRVTVEGAGLTGPDAALFDEDFSGPTYLSGGVSLDIEVAFDAPASQGTFNASLTVQLEGLPSLQVALRGISSHSAEPSGLNPSANTLDLGAISVDGTTSGSFSVTNTGSHLDITIAAIETVGTHAGEFETAAADMNLLPGESTEVDVVFEPESSGIKSAAVRIDHDGADAPTTVELSAQAKSEPPPPDAGFSDVGESIFQMEINWLAYRGITSGCNPPDNTLFCPTDFVTRGQMAAFLHRALDGILVPGEVPGFSDHEESVFESDIEWLGATGVTRGCNPPANDRFCPDDPVTRGQMAAFLHRALADELELTSFPTYTDDDSVFETDIEWLGATGVTRGCNPPANDRFCPGDLVTREQMAAFLYRALSE